MAATTGWIAGRSLTLTYVSAGFTAANFNSLADGSVVVAAAAIDNSTNLNLYADVSFSFVIGGTTTFASNLVLYILPLNQDATTYGDGTPTGTVLPVAGYSKAAIGVRAGILTGAAVVGTFERVSIPPSAFKFAIANALTIPLSASAAAAVQVRAYNENLNA